jgi:hypothetical protein
MTMAASVWARVCFVSGEEGRVSERRVGGDKGERQATCGCVRLPVVQSDEGSSEYERTESRERFRLLLNQGEHLRELSFPRRYDGPLCLLVFFSLRRPAKRQVDLGLDQSAVHDLTELFESRRAEVIGRVEFRVDKGRDGEEELDRVRDGRRGRGEGARILIGMGRAELLQRPE